MVVTNLCPNTCMEEMKAMENCNAWPMIPSLTGKDLLTRQVDALDATQDHYRTHLDAAAPIITTKLSRGQKHTTTKWIHLIAFALFFHLSNFFFPGSPFTCPKTGLLDLDLTNPCTLKDPCLLDRLSINDNVSIVCFECHEANRIMNPLHYFDVPDFDTQNYFLTQ